MPEKVKSPTGRKQVSRVMKAFHKGRLRGKDEKTVTELEQAQAIAMSEGREAGEHGVKKRTWKGRTRLRPILSKK